MKLELPNISALDARILLRKAMYTVERNIDRVRKAQDEHDDHSLATQDYINALVEEHSFLQLLYGAVKESDAVKVAA